MFDAFEFLNRFKQNIGYEDEAPSYYLKKNKETLQANLYTSTGGIYQTSIPIKLPNKLPSNSLHGRSSFRQIPRLTRTTLGAARFSITLPMKFGSHRVNIADDTDKPAYYIDRDSRFENDIELISERILKEIFRTETSSAQVKANYINPINNALDNIFGHQPNTRLSLLEIIPPLEGKIAQITFRKGQSEIHYNYLSAGEKEVVNILFNLLVRREQFTDTIYFFDELDLHLNTALQFNLLKEITENWIPENCQLWTASHSLGFIDYARQYEKGIILDFDDLDFDQPQTLYPKPNEQLDVYDIAVPKEMLLSIMSGKRIVVCENKNDEYYNLLALPDTLFVGVKDSRDVFLHIKREPRYHSLRDRDFLSDTEIERIHRKYPNQHILVYYDFENYVYHPDNLAELKPLDFDKEAYLAEMTRQKNERAKYILATLASSRQTYQEFKTDEKLKDQSTDAIADDLDSSDFERFYKFFDMKNQFKKDKKLLGFAIPEHKRLVQTTWFRQQIEIILNQ